MTEGTEAVLESQVEKLNQLIDDEPLPADEMVERLAEVGVLSRTSDIDPEDEELTHLYSLRSWTKDFLPVPWNVAHSDCCGLIGIDDGEYVIDEVADHD